MASGETNVKMTAVQTTACAIFGEEGDLETPAFILGPRASVLVESSQITGKIARLRGDPTRVPTWITFDNCRFRCGSDPRRDIEADDASGYRFRDCVVTIDDVRAETCKPTEQIMLPELVKLPVQAVAPARLGGADLGE